MIKEVARWDCLGQETCEQYTAQILKTGEVNIVDAKLARLILEIKNRDTSVIDMSKKYGVYYNYHPTSGHKTDITYTDGEFNINIIRPNGALCAFFSEVIILEIAE